MKRLPVALLIGLALATPGRSQDFLNRSVKTWTDQLADRDPAKRRAAAYALGKIGPDAVEAVKPLVALLDDRDATVREGAAWALGDVATPRTSGRVWTDAGESLNRLLADQSPRVRRAAAYALGRCGGLAKDAAEGLRRRLAEDDQPMVRQNAAWALGHLHGDTPDAITVKALIAASRKVDEDPSVLRDVVGALAEQIGDKPEATGEVGEEAAAALFALVKRDPGRPVVKPAVQALQRLATRKHEDQALSIEHLLDDRDPDIRRPTAFVLANAAGPKGGKAVKAFMEMLAEGEEKDKEAAAGGLSNLGEAGVAAVGDLARVLDDRNNSLQTRLAASFALCRIRKNIEPIIPSLVKALEPEESPLVRETAAEAMSGLDFGKSFEHKDLASSTLTRVLKEDAVSRVRQRALWALFTVPNLRAYDLLDPMMNIVKGKDGELRILRYDTARVLAIKQRDEAADEVIDALVDMLAQGDISVYVPSDAKGVGGGTETGGSGGTRFVQKKGGDARFMAAQALGMIGPRVAKRAPKSVELLKKLKESTDPQCREAADFALREISR